MSHDGGPSPMYWVIWSVFQNLRSFPVFPGATWSSCTAWTVSRAVFQFLRFEYGDSVGDLKGDPILIPCLASEAEAGFVPRSQDLRWVEYG